MSEVADDLGDADRHGAGRQRAMALGRMEPVGFDVEQVVPVVRAGGHEAEGHERDERRPQRAGVVEHACCAGRGEDEHVLHPLAGAGLTDEGADHGCAPSGVDGTATPLTKNERVAPASSSRSPAESP